VADTESLAVVTGAASGIGAATARRLADGGARVVVCDVDDAAGGAVADAIGGRFVHLDVGNAAAWAALAASLRSTSGRVERVLLNAGVLTTAAPTPFLDVPVGRLARVRAVNVDGVLLGVHSLAPLLAASGGGAIVATASLAGVGPWADDPMYAATKHAVVGFVRSVAPQLAARGVRLHAICPGGVDTGLLDRGRKAELVAEGRALLDADEVAVAVVDLLDRPEAGLVHTIVVGRGAEPYRFSGVPGPRSRADRP
jgi:NAD(P)-dependent dehydrogenase (short-subunit alcohol dehydrogenase family)